jgi:hypothetical protein
LALPDPKIDLIGFTQMMTQELPIPQILAVFQLPRRTAQVFLKLSSHSHVQRRGPSGSFSFLERGKPSLLKPLYPVLNGSPTVSEQFSDISTAIPVGHHQDPMKTMIVTGLFGSLDLLLDGDPHDIRIFDLQSLHSFLRRFCKITKRKMMRNYL